MPLTARVPWSPLLSLLPISLCLLSLLPFAAPCTTILVGRKATTDGAPLVTHNNDCTDCDIRIAVIPAADHPPSSSCPVWPCKFAYPRFVSEERGSAYTAEATAGEALPGPFPASVPLGHIQQVRHTWSYLEGSYPIANEWGLAMGESTCTAAFVAYPAPLGDALWDVTQLMRVALERCKTARCAISLMGQLAEQGGYYGSSDPPSSGAALFEESGEALTLIDSTGEAWVFHILPDDTGRSAIWAAQRLADDSFTVVANKFTIRRIDLSQPDRFLASSNVVEVAERAGLWPSNSSEPFDFSAAYAPDARDPPGWVDRRVWALYTKVAPSLKLQSNAREPYPFSVKPEAPVSLEAVRAMTRDHFEGTQFDLSVGPASGAFNNPTRYDRPHGEEYVGGMFERAISLHRTTYAFVATARPWLPHPLSGVVWFCHHAPHSSLFVPLYSATGEVDASWRTGTLFELRRENAWWAFASVTNAAEKMYGFIQQDVTAWQRQHEAAGLARIHQLDAQLKATAVADPDAATAAVTAYSVNASRSAVELWWRLLDVVTCKWRDGQLLAAQTLPIDSQPLFYPPWWLHGAGYYVGEPAELHQDLVPPPPPHPERAQAAVALTAVAPSFHPALGRSWERRWNTQRTSRYTDGVQPSRAASAAVERNARPSMEVMEAHAEGAGKVDASSKVSLGIIFGVFVLLLLSVAPCVLCFRAGQKWERQKYYELIA